MVPTEEKHARDDVDNGGSDTEWDGMTWWEAMQQRKKNRLLPMIWGVNKHNQIFFQRSEKAAYEKTWTKVEGGLKQISTGPVGTFGVNRHNERNSTQNTN